MATGNNIQFSLHKTEHKPNAESIKSSQALIGLSAASFSVMLVNSQNSQVEALAHCAMPHNQMKAQERFDFYQAALRKLDWPLAACSKIQGVFSNEKFSLLPESLYQKGIGAQVLSYSSSLDEGDEVYSEHWPSSQCLLLYALPEADKNWLVKQFPQATFKHQASSYPNLYKPAASASIYLHLHIAEHTAHFFVGRNGQVLLYNHFPFNTEEDLLYYVLFALEQNRVLATEEKLYLSGYSLKGHKLYTLLSRHIGEVEELPLPPQLKVGSKISAMELRQHINLFAAL